MGSLLPGRRGLRPSARAARRERARAARAAAARRRGRDDVTRRRCAAPLSASLRPASLRLLCPPALRARGADRPRVPDPRRSQAAPGARGADQLERCGALALPLPSRSPTASSTAASARPPASPPSPPRPRRHPLPRRRPRRRHQDRCGICAAPRRRRPSGSGSLLPQGRATHRRGRAGLGGRLRGRTELYHPMARDHFSRVLPFLALPLVPRCLFLSRALWLAARLIALADAYPPHLAGLAEALRGIVLDAHRRDYPRGGVDGKCSERGRPRGRAARSATLCCVC